MERSKTIEIHIGQRPFYRLPSHPAHFTTGKCAHGRQAIMGLIYPELVTVLFDAGGRYAETQARRLPFEAEALSPEGPFRLFKPAFQEKTARELARWQAELGLQRRPIVIRPFFLFHRWIGIEDLPVHLREIAEKPELIEPGDPLELRVQLERWLSEGNFVFWWCEDYHVDRQWQEEADAGIV